MPVQRIKSIEAIGAGRRTGLIFRGEEEPAKNSR
jgi:hypothetical protein